MSKTPIAATLNAAAQIQFCDVFREASPARGPAATRPNTHAAQAATSRYPMAAVQKIRDENMRPMPAAGQTELPGFPRSDTIPPPFGLGRVGPGPNVSQGGTRATTGTLQLRHANALRHARL